METKAKKIREAAKLAKQIEEFKARGGEIERIHSTKADAAYKARAVGSSLEIGSL